MANIEVFKDGTIVDYDSRTITYSNQQHVRDSAALAGKPLSTGLKYDDDKPRTDLLDPQALEGLARVLSFGATKYAAHNWRGGISYSRLIGAALRHIFAILKGEDIDPESGLPHVDHLGCCWMFLSNMMKTRPDLDDRWKG